MIKIIVPSIENEPGSPPVIQISELELKRAMDAVLDYGKGWKTPEMAVKSIADVLFGVELVVLGDKGSYQSPPLALRTETTTTP